MNNIKETIYNTVVDWNKIIEKAGVEKFDEYESVELTVIIDDKHQISNLAYIFIFKRFLKKVKIILEKSKKLINWTYNDFYFEISTLLLVTNYYQQSLKQDNVLEIVVSDENGSLKHIINNPSETLYAQTTMPIIIFNSKDLKRIKESSQNLFTEQGEKINFEIFGNMASEDININFIKMWTEQCKKSIQKQPLKNEIVSYKDKFDIFTMMIFMYLIQKVEFSTIEQLNDLANEIKYFCSGIYQILENSCFHSESKEAIFVLSYLNFKDSNSKKIETFLENNKAQYKKRLSYLKNYGFKLDGEYYATIRIIDDARETPIKVKNLVEKAKSNYDSESIQSNLLLEFYKERDSFLKNKTVTNENGPEIAEISKKYGILMFLAVASTLDVQGTISSGDFSIYLDYAENIKNKDSIFNSILEHNKFVTEYTYAVPLKAIDRKIENIHSTHDISVLNVNQQFTVKKCRFNEDKLHFEDDEGKVEAVKELYTSLLKNYSKNIILVLEFNSTMNVEVVVKSIANLIYKQKSFPVYIVINFIDNIEKNKLMIRDFIFFYRILCVKLQYLLNKEMILYNDNDIQIAFYSRKDIDNPKLFYVSTIVGIDNNIVIRSFVNNLLYNNEFSTNDFFDLYIDDIRLSDITKSYKIEVFPAELFIKEQAKLFIDNLDEIINSNHIHHKNVNVLLGSGIHLRDFYEAEFVFQSKYLVARLALLIKTNLKPFLLSKFKTNITEKKNTIVIVGYASYSYLLGETLKSFIINDTEFNVDDVKFIYFEHSNIKYDELDKLKISNNNYYYVALIPIASTLNTVFKMNKLLNYILLNDNNNFNFDMIYSILTVQPNLNNSQWRITEDINEQFKTIEIEYKKNVKIQIKTLLIKEGNSDKNVEILPVSKVDRTSTVQDSIYEIEPVLKEESSEQNFQKFKFMIDAVKYGHYQLKNKHYLYYINYKKVFQGNENKILSEMKKELKGVKINLLALNIVISPLSGNNHKFLEAVLNNVFSGNAILIQFNKETTYRENFLHKYSHIKEKIERIMKSATNSVVNFYYVDNSIISGKTFNRAKELVNILISDVKNESSQRIPFRIFEKAFLFINRSNKNTLNTLMNDEKNVYRFININCPSFEMTGLTCPDCKITENYLKLSSILSYSDHSYKWLEKAEEHKAVIINNQSDLDYNKKDFIRLCFTHLLLERRSDFQIMYKNLLDKVINENKCFDEIEKIKLELTMQIKGLDSSLGSSDFDELFVRVISRPFLTTYECIKQVSFIYLRQLLEKKINQYDEKTIIFIINRISYFGSNYLNEVFDRGQIINKSEEFKNCFERALIFERACARGIVK